MQILTLVKNIMTIVQRSKANASLLPERGGLPRLAVFHIAFELLGKLLAQQL